MNIENLYRIVMVYIYTHLWVQVVGAILLYGVIGWILGLCIEYVFGWRVQEKFLIIWFLPLVILEMVVRRILRLLTWPIRYRRQRIFREAFEFDPPTGSEEIQGTQGKVDSHLRFLAGWMHRAFQAEEAARGTSTHDEKRQSVQYAKDSFWEAHNIAKHFGYAVKTSYKEYLPSNPSTVSETGSRRPHNQLPHSW